MTVIIGTWLPSVMPPRVPTAILVNLRERSIRRNGSIVFLGPVEMKVAACLLAAELMSQIDLVRATYGERWDGGPVQALDCIRLYIHKLRRKLAPLGVRIITRWGIGFEVVT